MSAAVHLRFSCRNGSNTLAAARIMCVVSLLGDQSTSSGILKKVILKAMRLVDWKANAIFERAVPMWLELQFYGKPC